MSMQRLYWRSVMKGLLRKQIVDASEINGEMSEHLHAAHTLEKTGMANRAEATAYAIRNGITEEEE